MATDTKTTVNEPRPVDPVPAPPDMPLPAPPDLLLPAGGPIGNPLDGALIPAFVLMVFGACFIINPMGHGAAAQDEALLAFCVFWLGTLSLLCRPILVARLPAVANAPACIVRFAQNCIFGPGPDP